MALLLVLLSQAHGLFDASRVHFIDRGPRNWLFRSGSPLAANRTFELAPLLARVRAVANASGVTLPADVFVVDVCLLEIEWRDVMAERAFFAKNPSLGAFVHHPIVGTLVNPAKVAPALRSQMARDLNTWGVDKLPSFVDSLRAMLVNTTFPKAAVIVVHCEGGEDRTGEVSAAYYMRYLQWSFSRALQCKYTSAYVRHVFILTAACAVDNHIESRNIACNNANEAAWYCYHLQETLQSPPWLGSCDWPTQPYCSGL